MNLLPYLLNNCDLNPTLINNSKILLSPLLSEQARFVDIQRELNSLRNNDSINKPGVYLWTFNIENKEYKLYIGKASPLQRMGVINRLKDYFNKFQSQSPNDFKINHFNNYIRLISREVTYKMYYWIYEPIEELSLSAIEKILRNQLKPVFNNKKIKLPVDLLKLLENINQIRYNLFFDSRFK